MRVLITGGSGVVGWALARHSLSLGREVHLTYLSHPVKLEQAESHPLDITDASAVEGLVSRIRPDLIYHCAALTNVDKCETDHALADLQNAHATGLVAAAAEKAGAQMAYISTSFVFGDSQQPLAEDAPCSPANYYGKTKAEGERLVRKECKNHLILRIDQPYGWVEAHQKQNTVVRVIKSLKAGQAVREPADWLNSPTYLDNFVRLAEALRSRGKTGTYNCVGAEFLSRYDWAVKIARAFHLDEKLIAPFHASELHLAARRPSVRLDISKAQSHSGMRISGIDEGLADMILHCPKE